MTKVLLINGSPNKKGNTVTALNEVAKVLNGQGIETELVHIGNKAVRGCIGCGKCFEKGNGRCIFNDDVTNEISAKAATADGFVLGSPVFYGQPNGALMSIVQRMLYSNSGSFSGKPVANIAVCRRGGASSAYQAMNMPWMMVNCPIVTSQYWNIAYGMLPGEAAADAEGMQTMRSLASNMVFMLQSFEGRQRPDYEPWQPTHFVREDLKKNM